MSLNDNRGFLYVYISVFTIVLFVIQLYPFYYFTKPYMVRFRNIFFQLRLFQNKLVYYILYMLNHSVTHTHSVVDSSNNVVKKSVTDTYSSFDASGNVIDKSIKHHDTSSSFDICGNIIYNSITDTYSFFDSSGNIIKQKYSFFDSYGNIVTPNCTIYDPYGNIVDNSFIQMDESSNDTTDCSTNVLQIE